MSKKFYYLDASDEVLGPFPLVELDALHKSGKITAVTKICEEGTQNWMPFYEIPRPAAPKAARQEKTAEVKEAPKARKPPEFQGITQSQGATIIALLLIGIGAPFWVLFKPTPPPPPIPQWEYEIVAPSDTMFISMMDRYGREGWELVSTRRAVDDGVGAYECILKRPKR